MKGHLHGLLCKTTLGMKIKPLMAYAKGLRLLLSLAKAALCDHILDTTLLPADLNSKSILFRYVMAISANNKSSLI